MATLVRGRKRANFHSSPSKAHALVFRNLVCVGMFPVMEHEQRERFDVNDLFLRQGAKQCHNHHWVESVARSEQSHTYEFHWAHAGKFAFT